MSYQNILDIEPQFISKPIDTLWAMFPQLSSKKSFINHPEKYHDFMVEFCLSILNEGCIKVNYLNEDYISFNTFNQNSFLLCSLTSSKVIGLYFYGLKPYPMQMHKPLLFDPQKNILFTSHAFDSFDPPMIDGVNASKALQEIQSFLQNFKQLLDPKILKDVFYDFRCKFSSNYQSNLVMESGVGHLYHDLINVLSLIYDIKSKSSKNQLSRLKQFCSIVHKPIWPVSEVTAVPHVDEGELNQSIYLRVFGSQPSDSLFDQIRDVSLLSFHRHTPTNFRLKINTFERLFPVVTFVLRPDNASVRGSRGFIDQFDTLQSLVKYLKANYNNPGIMIDGFSNPDWHTFSHKIPNFMAEVAETANGILTASEISFINLLGFPCFYNIVADYFSDLFICSSGSGLCRPYYVSGLNGIIHSTLNTQEDNAFRSWNYSSRSQFYGRSTVHNHIYLSDNYRLSEKKLFSALNDLIEKSGRVYGPELF